MARSCSRINGDLKGMRVLLFLLIFLLLSVVLLMTYSSPSMDRLITTATGSISWTSLAQGGHNQTDRQDGEGINKVSKTYQEEKEVFFGGFFGLFKSISKYGWTKPFQSPAFRDPPPSSWDANIENNENVDEDDDEDDEANEYGIYIESDPGENGSETLDQATDERLNNSNTASTEEVQEEKGVENESETMAPMQIEAEELFQTLENKLKNVTARERQVGETCYDKRTISNSCDNGQCLQTELPAEPQERVKQLINNPGLLLSASQHAVLQEMASKVRNSYDVILLTTASSNHFLESQALLQNLHQNVFPALKNFTLLFYDLGLTPDERKQMEKYCRCQVLSFPFDKFPEYARRLMCYAWKPLMIKAHIRQANVILWLDASIRFKEDPGRLQLLVQRVKERGVQIGGSFIDSTFRTFRSMYHFFGDEPCAYRGMGQARATIGGYHNEPFVDRVVLEPWAACALHEDCMCPPHNKTNGCSESKKMAENLSLNNGPIIYGLCHRFDQSAISLILHKLYLGKYPWVMMNLHQYGDIKRDHQVEYFKGLEK